MSDVRCMGEQNSVPDVNNQEKGMAKDSRQPDYEQLQKNLAEASKLVDDIVLKKYLHKLTSLNIVPLDKSLKNIAAIRFFKITEMVYQNNEYSTYKFASVFSAVQSLNSGVFIIADSDGMRTDFYMGVRSFDGKWPLDTLEKTLCNALRGQFPGVQIQKLMEDETSEFLSGIQEKSIASVSCVAKNKDEEFIGYNDLRKRKITIHIIKFIQL